MVLNARNIVNYVNGLSDKRLRNLMRQKPFTVMSTPDGIEIPRASSRKPRHVSFGRIQGVCEDFLRSKSMKPADYHTITFDASYLLAIIDGLQRFYDEQTAHS
jgi:hypothetical protein